MINTIAGSLIGYGSGGALYTNNNNNNPNNNFQNNGKINNLKKISPGSGLDDSNIGRGYNDNGYGDE